MPLLSKKVSKEPKPQTILNKHLTVAKKAGAAISTP